MGHGGLLRERMDYFSTGRLLLVWYLFPQNPGTAPKLKVYAFRFMKLLAGPATVVLSLRI